MESACKSFENLSRRFTVQMACYNGIMHSLKNIFSVQDIWVFRATYPVWANEFPREMAEIEEKFENRDLVTRHLEHIFTQAQIHRDVCIKEHRENMEMLIRMANTELGRINGEVRRPHPKKTERKKPSLKRRNCREESMEYVTFGSGGRDI